MGGNRCVSSVLSVLLNLLSCHLFFFIEIGKDSPLDWALSDSSHILHTYSSPSLKSRWLPSAQEVCPMIRSKKALLLFFYPHKGAVLSLHLRRYKEHFDHQLDPNHSQQMKNCVSLLLSYPKVSSQHPSHLFPPTYFTYHWDSCYSHSLQASVESTTK